MSNLQDQVKQDASQAKAAVEAKADGMAARLGKFVARHPLVDLAVIAGIGAALMFLGVL